MALDSDVPNADSQLFVQFYVFRDEPYKGQTFIRKMAPGDQLNVVERPMRDHDKRDFPRQWLGFLAQSSPDEIQGTPLKKWNLDRPFEVTYAQIEELQMLKFQTVEQVRDASDAHLQRIGMGGPGLREKAKAYLAGKNKAAESSEMDAMKARMAELETLLATRSQAPIETKKPGWPKGKPRKSVNVVNNDAATHAAGDQ